MDGYRSVTSPGAERSLRLAYAAWGIASAVGLLVMIVSSPPTEVYDEPYHMGLARLVERDGLSEALMSPNNQSAAGPLFPVTHCLLRPLTGGRPPFTRLVNYCFLIGSIGLVYSTLAAQSRFAREAAVSLLAVPQLWKCVGMALTEVPALFFFSLFMAIVLRTMRFPTAARSSLASGVLAGACLGAAILGRQTYLVAVGPVIVIAALHRHLRLQASAMLLACSLVCGWVFLLWGGLVTPSQRSIDSAWSLYFGFLSFGYIGVASFLLWPRRYTSADRTSLMLALAIGVCATLVQGAWIPLPGHGTLKRLLPEPVALGIGFVSSPLFNSVGALWCILLVKDLVRCIRSPGPAFILMTTLVLAIAPAKISHLFSSRYTVGTLGAECARNTEFEPSWMHLGFLICGSIAGAVSLAAHYAA